MTMGIMPITGIPLLFVSYGGSALLNALIAVGILLNIHQRRLPLLDYEDSMVIDPVRKLGNRLLGVEKPARYSGGEVGSIRKSSTTGFRIALSFPDLYEIGMSNFSIKILYSRLNALEGVACERVFAPAPDFEELLIDEKMLLYSLENGIPLNEFDLLSFSVGYELSATTILTILDRGGIPLRRTDRGED